MPPRGVLLSCIHPGCPEYAVAGTSRCEGHTESQPQRRARGLTGQRGSTYAWRQLRKRIFIHQHGRCLWCDHPLIEGHWEVHHLDANSHNNDRTNLAALCTPCHLTTYGRRNAPQS